MVHFLHDVIDIGLYEHVFAENTSRNFGFLVVIPVLPYSADKGAVTSGIEARANWWRKTIKIIFGEDELCRVAFYLISYEVRKSEYFSYFIAAALILGHLGYI